MQGKITLFFSFIIHHFVARVVFFFYVFMGECVSNQVQVYFQFLTCSDCPPVPFESSLKNITLMRMSDTGCLNVNF